MRIPALLFLASTCFGQLTTQTMQPFFNTRLSSIVQPDQLTEQALEHWWRASDLNGVTPLNYDWNDRIQANFQWHFELQSSGTAPTVTSVSVTNTGTSWLTNKTRTYTFTSATLYRTVVFIIKPATNTAAYGLFCNDSLNGFSWSQALKRTLADNLNFSSSAGTNRWLQDWIITQTNLGATPNLIAFTNNVQSASGSGQGSAVAIFNLMGNGNNFVGDIYEVLCYTNKVGFGGFTNPTDLANLHKYATNTYSFSP